MSEEKRNRMVLVIGAMGNIEDVNQAMSIIFDYSRKWKTEIQIFNAELVFGKEHLLSAYEHAKRAFEQGTNLGENLAMEMLLYASGERQISKAIEKMGIRKGSRRVAIAVEGAIDDAQVSALLSALRMKRDDSALSLSGKSLEAFGITGKEMGAVPEERRHNLILERVAMVDLMK